MNTSKVKTRAWIALNGRLHYGQRTYKVGDYYQIGRKVIAVKDISWRDNRIDQELTILEEGEPMEIKQENLFGTDGTMTQSIQLNDKITQLKKEEDMKRGIERTLGRIETIGKSGRAVVVTLEDGTSGATMHSWTVNGWEEGDTVELMTVHSGYAHRTLLEGSKLIKKG